MKKKKIFFLSFFCVFFHFIIPLSASAVYTLNYLSKRVITGDTESNIPNFANRPAEFFTSGNYNRATKELAVDVKGRLIYKVSGELLDTTRRLPNERKIEAPGELHRYIFVMDENGLFYVAMHNTMGPEKFSHSSFGLPAVAGYGRLEASNGILSYLNDDSGHYGFSNYHRENTRANLDFNSNGVVLERLYKLGARSNLISVHQMNFETDMRGIDRRAPQREYYVKINDRGVQYHAGEDSDEAPGTPKPIRAPAAPAAPSTPKPIRAPVAPVDPSTPKPFRPTPPSAPEL